MTEADERRWANVEGMNGRKKKLQRGGTLELPFIWTGKRERKIDELCPCVS